MKYIRRVIPVLFLAGLAAIVWLLSPHLTEGVSRREAVFKDREVKFLVVNITQQAGTIKLVNDSLAPKSVLDWRGQLGASVVWNAAYFNADNSPTGYFKSGEYQGDTPWPSLEEQQEIASYTFLVSFANDGLSLAYLPDNPQAEPSGDAFLSFPTLLASGESIVTEDSLRPAQRTVLAEDTAGNDYLIVSEKGTVTLFELAQWLSEQPENFIIAGNLDGGPSTGVSMENGIIDLEVPSAKVPSVMVITGE